MTGDAASHLPLLHIAQAAARATTLDLRLAGLAALLFGVFLAWPWLQSGVFLHFLLRRRTRGRIVWGAVSVGVFLAVLPSAVPYDHLFGPAHAASAEEEHVHVSHCHISPGTCSDAPVTSGPGQMLLAQPLIVVPAMLAVLVMLAAPVMAGISQKPEIRPPVNPGFALA